MSARKKESSEYRTKGIMLNPLVKGEYKGGSGVYQKCRNFKNLGTGISFLGRRGGTIKGPGRGNAETHIKERKGYH